MQVTTPGLGFSAHPGGWPELAEGTIHVWKVALEPSREVLAELSRELTPDEGRRAARFRFPEHRRRFTAGRGSLRRILGRYLERPAKELELDYGHRGKPFLVRHPDLHFNLSHSGTYALLAVTRVGRVGVDIEELRELSDLEGIARRFFAAGEYDRLRGLPAEERCLGFFHCWTRKEAYIKAVGEGLALPLDRFEVSLEPGEAARFLDFRDPSEHPERWSLFHLHPLPGYTGALAIEGRGWEVGCWEWGAEELDSR